MLELLDLRERGERLQPSRCEADPTLTETVRGAAARLPRATATIARAECLIGHAAATEARRARR